VIELLDKRYVTFYARSSRVPLDVAERDVILTYVLRILSKIDILPRLAFKGGTCLKKVYFGNLGRFSMDLDFTSSDIPLEELRDGLKQSLDKHRYYDIEFRIAEENVRESDANVESYLAVIHYAHNWNSGEFMLEVSYREKPLLPLQKALIHDEMYFKYCEFPRFTVKCLQKEELLSEKLRAAFQRIRARDLYDIYLFSGRPFDRDLVKKLIVIKCWNVRDPFNPDKFLSNIAEEQYDWNDLQRLVRKGDLPPKETVIEKVIGEYTFLKDLNKDLLKIIKDSKAHKERELVTKILGERESFN